MDLTGYLTLAGIVALLLLSAMFSGSESALTAVSRARMHHLSKRGDRRARQVGRLIAERARLIAAILIGNNLVNILASALATSMMIRLAGDAGVAYATLLMTLLVVVFAEVIPKAYALRDPDRVALRVARPVGLMLRLLSPFAFLVQALADGLFRLFGLGRNRGDVSPMEELRGAVDLHASEGRMGKADRDMLRGLLDLSELTVEDVMVHRRHIVMLDISEPTEQLVATVLGNPHTRFPVHRGDAEEIVGVLHAKELLRALRAPGEQSARPDVGKLLRPAWFVPETTPLAEQIHAFRVRRDQLALVVDEYGSLMGLVTLEDIIEEIVGDITGGQVGAAERIQRQADGSYLVDGTVPIRDLNRHCEWELPDDEAATVAGLVIHVARHIPEVGERFEAHGFAFEVLKRQRNQVTAIVIRPRGRPA